MHKKITSLGFLFLNKHSTIEVYESNEGKQYIVLEGIKSREVDNAISSFWLLVEEIEKMILN